MSFWPFNTLHGYVRAQAVSSDKSENSIMFYFGAKNPNTRKKKKAKHSPAHLSTFPNNNNQENTQSTRNEYELLVVKKQDRCEYYRVPLSKNETLHTIAMKFGCSVWELKRANRLWGLQDVHALSSLVVPAPRDSYRAELLAKSGGRLVGRHCCDDSADNSQAEGASAATVVDLYDVDDDLHDSAGDLAAGSMSAGGKAATSAAAGDDQRRPVSLRQAMSSSDSLTATDCDRFLRTLDADLEQIKQSTCFLKDSLTEAADYLNTPSVLPPSQYSSTPSWLRRLKGSGADGGLSWRGAVCLMCVLCLLVPALIYFVVVHRQH